MKKNSLPPLLLLSLLLVQPSQAPAVSAMQGKQFRKTVEFEPGGSLTIRTDKGSVRLTSWDQNQVEVFARIEPPDEVSEDYARRAVEAARVEVVGDARSLTVRSNFDDVPYRDGFGDRDRRLPHIHYEIRAPRRLNLDLEVDRSRVELAEFEGRIRLHTDRTPLKAADLAGEIRLQMDRGEATLSRIRGAFDIEADRTNVDLQATNIEGDSKVDIDRGEFELRLPDSQRLSIRTDISRRGSFNSDFGITAESMRGNNIEGTINGGGPRLYMQTDRGRIRLRRQ